jgi:hypothetical protein
MSFILADYDSELFPPEKIMFPNELAALFTEDVKFLHFFSSRERKYETK